MTDLLLATCRAFPDGEPGGGLLLEAFRARGVDAAWGVWDDPAVPWADARLVAVRSTWDYEDRRDEFVSWARATELVTPLTSPAAVLAWNTDKGYLLDLVRAGLPVVPTSLAEDELELPAAIAAYDRAVVKPRVGAGGRGVVLFDGEPGGPADLDESQLGPGPWVVQPLVESVRTEGETSLFVFGGRAASQVRKQPAAGEIRVHEWYGGSTVTVALDEEAAGLADRTVEVAQGLLGVRLPFARVDLMRMPDGHLAVGELEVTEAGLYLDELPENARSYADALTDLLTDLLAT